MFTIKNIKMEYIEKKDGGVWLVKTYGIDGRHKTITWLGKDEETEEKKEKKKKTSAKGKKKKGEE